ncbi:MAG: hypothetical protein ACFE8N_16200 [Promethearchaeota archaeon]
MGLDKWLKSEETSKKEQKEIQLTKQEEIRKKKLEVKKDTEKISTKLMKQVLVCPSAKCKYQKTIMKKELTKIDRICPRCKKEMKVKK